MQCTWCENKDTEKSTKTCYWVMPDGKRYIEITDIPAIQCEDCGTYLTDEMNQEIDNLLYMKKITNDHLQITYQNLLDAPMKENLLFK